MNNNQPESLKSSSRIQSRLFILAALFVFLYAITYTLSPTVLLRSWHADLIWGHWIGYGIWLISFYIIFKKCTQLFPEMDPLILPIVALLTGKHYYNMEIKYNIWIETVYMVRC